MNKTFHEQLLVVRTTLFGPAPKPKRTRRVKLAPIPVVPNTLTHYRINSVTVSLVG